MKLFFLALLLLISGALYADVKVGKGVDVGNGGDLVKCVPNQANDLFGLYSLDYLIFSRAPGQQPAAVQSWQESIYKIRRVFVDKLPELLPVFDEFANNNLNEDHTRGQIWEPTEYTLREINDEDLPASVQIPVNCRDGGKIELIQAVIRQNPEFTGSNLVVYKYMPKIFEKMEKDRPLQLSFLLVHEFLWSISDSVDRNRRINWFLHSDEIQKMSRMDVIDRLLSMGLDVKSIPRIVDAGGRGHFTSLQEAIQKSRDGETLLLKEGIYTMAGSVITHSLNLIGEGSRGKTVIKGSYSDPALKLALEKNQTVRVENVLLSRMADFEHDDYLGARTIDFGTPGSLILKNVVVRGQGKFLMSLLGSENLDFDNVVLEGHYAFWFGQYWGQMRLKDVTLISEWGSNRNWFWERGGELGKNIKIVNFRNQTAKMTDEDPSDRYDAQRIWEDWSQEVPGSVLAPDPDCKPEPE